MNSKDSPIFPEEQPRPQKADDAWLYSEKDGLLNVPRGGTEGAEGAWMREHHNASHALWYFTMIIYAMIHDKGYQNNLRKTERILAHMAHLREFINDHGSKSHKVVNQLFDALMLAKPDSNEKWIQFIYANWNLIWSFAERYGYHEKCFPLSDYQKIQDLFHKRMLWKGWWIRIQFHNIRKQLVKRA